MTQFVTDTILLQRLSYMAQFVTVLNFYTLQSTPHISPDKAGDVVEGFG